MIGRKIIEVNPPISKGYQGLYRLSIKDDVTGVIYPMDVTDNGLRVILLENKILGFGCPDDLVQSYRSVLLAEHHEGD
jgi:hypothetical protein